MIYKDVLFHKFKLSVRIKTFVEPNKGCIIFLIDMISYKTLDKSCVNHPVMSLILLSDTKEMCWRGKHCCRLLM